MLPGRWQFWHFACRIGATSLANVTWSELVFVCACAMPWAAPRTAASAVRLNTAFRIISLPKGYPSKYMRGNWPATSAFGPSCIKERLCWIGLWLPNQRAGTTVPLVLVRASDRHRRPPNRPAAGELRPYSYMLLPAPDSAPARD